MSTTDSLLETNKVKYLDLTHKLNDYNEIYNVNTYVKDTNALQLERFNATNNNLRTRLLRMKQEYMLKEHDISEYRFRTNIIYFTFIIISFVLIIATMFMLDKMSGTIAMVVSISVLLVYLIILMFVMKAQANRKKNSYNQYYFSQANF